PANALSTGLPRWDRAQVALLESRSAPSWKEITTDQIDPAIRDWRLAAACPTSTAALVEPVELLPNCVLPGPPRGASCWGRAARWSVVAEPEIYPASSQRLGAESWLYFAFAPTPTDFTELSEVRLRTATIAEPGPVVSLPVTELPLSDRHHGW